VTAAQLKLFVTILWSIWKSRNLKLWQQEEENNNNIIERAKHLLEGWRITNRKQHGLQQHDSTAAAINTSAAQSGHRRNDVIKWQKPRRGRMKCNVDASFSASRNRFGIGMCIRDDEGQFVLAKTMWFTLMCSVDEGEALGLYHAMRWISDLQLSNVDFEVDSKRVADYFNRGNGDITEFGVITDSNIQFCSLQLTNSQVEFIRRQANVVAHELAQAATSSSSFRTYIEIPDCINNLIANEML
jgi:ribonuclease HI